MVEPLGAGALLALGAASLASGIHSYRQARSAAAGLSGRAFTQKMHKPTAQLARSVAAGAPLVASGLGYAGRHFGPQVRSGLAAAGRRMFGSGRSGVGVSRFRYGRGARIALWQRMKRRRQKYYARMRRNRFNARMRR
jgi:hypothetical protein